MKKKELFTAVLHSFIRNPSLTVNEKMVLLSIATHWPNAFPSEKKLCEYLDLGRRTVKRAVLSLESKGYLHVKRERFSVNRYEILNGIKLSPGAKKDPRSGAKNDHLTPLSGCQKGPPKYINTKTPNKTLKEHMRKYPSGIVKERDVSGPQSINEIMSVFLTKAALGGE
jgi:DNA-binding transcriptional MocR family regulator